MDVTDLHYKENAFMFLGYLTGRLFYLTQKKMAAETVTLPGMCVVSSVFAEAGLAHPAAAECCPVVRFVDIQI